MRRIVAALSTVAAALLLLAGPALAHEEINPAVITTGKPTFFTLNAANEKTVGLNKITLTAPAGLAFGAATKSPPGWTANRTDTVVTWTGGPVAPDEFDQWGFEIEGADQPGTFTYKVGLGFADGSSDDVDVVVTATSASPGAATGGSSSSSAEDSDTNANVAFVVGILALVVALIALILALRKKGAGSGSGGGTGSAPATPAGKDW